MTRLKYMQDIDILTYVDTRDENRTTFYPTAFRIGHDQSSIISIQCITHLIFFQPISSFSFFNNIFQFTLFHLNNSLRTSDVNYTFKTILLFSHFAFRKSNKKSKTISEKASWKAERISQNCPTQF